LTPWCFGFVGRLGDASVKGYVDLEFDAVREIGPINVIQNA